MQDHRIFVPQNRSKNYSGIFISLFVLISFTEVNFRDITLNANLCVCVCVCRVLYVW